MDDDVFFGGDSYLRMVMVIDGDEWNYSLMMF